MLRLHIELWNGQNRKVEFNDDDIGFSYGGKRDIASRTIMECETISDQIRSFYVEGGFGEPWALRLGWFTDMEYIEFDNEVKNLHDINLPAQGNYKVVNVPLGTEVLACNPYATIENMDELLKEDDITINMRSS